MQGELFFALTGMQARAEKSSLVPNKFMSRTRQELDLMHLWRGLSPQEVRARLQARRDKAGIGTPNIKQVRKALAGKTFKRGAAETRGAKPKLSKTNVCCSRMLSR